MVMRHPPAALAEKRAKTKAKAPLRTGKSLKPDKIAQAKPAKPQKVS